MDIMCVRTLYFSVFLQDNFELHIYIMLIVNEFYYCRMIYTYILDTYIHINIYKYVYKHMFTCVRIWV